jgi:Flp pilus assembly protein TadG
MKIFLLKRSGVSGSSSGIVALEFALILPILVVMAFATIDFGRLIYARLVITNVSREGGDIASRSSLDITDSTARTNFFNLMLISGQPLDLNTYGKIYITKIVAGASSTSPKPTMTQYSTGSLSVSSKITSSGSTMGLTTEMYNHLQFNTGNQAADISNIYVVEVYFRYQTITPLPNFLKNTFLTGGGFIIGSKAVF